MKSNRDLKATDEKSILKRAKAQLVFTKKQTRELIDAHNKVTTLIWKIDLALEQLKQTSIRETKPEEIKDNYSKIEFLNEKKRLLTDCLEQNNSIEMINQKLSEIEALEHKIDPAKKINFNSPYPL